jgi:4'-phosphopantetheinyl transferase
MVECGAFAEAMTAALCALGDAVHVYRLHLADCVAINDTLLSHDERERAARFRHEPSKRAFVAVRSALRVLLGRYLDADPAHLTLISNDKGKPRLAGTEPNQGLVFNVSHSGDWGVLAFSFNTALGVDVEQKRTIAHQEGMAERCFAKPELTWWRGLAGAEQSSAFFDFWCCKEAFVKATGEGIGLGLDACVVDLSGLPKMSAVPLSCGVADEWRLHQFDIEADYHAAVCYRGNERELCIQDLKCVEIHG